ncbi:MAG: class I SAM-dependent methyltransferase, partial [Rivularia sp. ALOHA_DT_140]|nr:class I SAM-dependent methyltransferase [Rivularia sp. ALOHA_DT_140]
GHFVPGYASIYEIAGCYLNLNIPSKADILIVGAGAGMEIKTLAKFSPHWLFTGVDPSSRMLDIAQFWVERSNLQNRVNLIEGLITDVSDNNLFDAVTCILVMHFVQDENQKLELLKKIYRKLKPGGLLVLTDMVIPSNPQDFKLFKHIYRKHAEFHGESDLKIEQILTTMNTSVFPISSKQETELIVKAGFNTPVMFFSSLYIQAWFAKKE